MDHSEVADEPPLDVGALTKRFKQRRDATNNVHQNWQIRLHRSLSWLNQANQFGSDQPEARFVFLWIAFNCLYSRWDQVRNAPDFDAPSRRDFLCRICRMDPRLVEQFMRKNRGLVKKLLSDPYLSDVYWREPDHPKAKGRATQDANHIDQHYKEQDYFPVLREATNRLYVLRGQIVHGASTSGSRLNRTSLRYCEQMLQLLVPVLQHIMIEHGCHDDWPELCYPPRK